MDLLVLWNNCVQFLLVTYILARLSFEKLIASIFKRKDSTDNKYQRKKQIKFISIVPPLYNVAGELLNKIFLKFTCHSGTCLIFQKSKKKRTTTKNHVLFVVFRFFFYEKRH